MNRFCTSCGDELVPGNLFCATCGAQIDDPEPVPAEPAEATSPPSGAPKAAAGGSSVLLGLQQKLGTAGLVDKVRTATTQELAKDAAKRTIGSWVALWVVIAVLSQVGVVIIDTGDLSINGASLASVIMALGFGGSVTASGSGGFAFASGEGSLWVHYAPFIVALVYAVALRFAFGYKPTRRTESDLVATGLVSALCAGVVTLVFTIFGNLTISGLLEEEVGIESSIGLTWFVPVVCASVLTALVVAWPVLANKCTRLRSSLIDLVGVFAGVFVLLIVVGLATIVYYGVRVATGAVELDIQVALAGLVGAVLFLPNAVVAGLSLLTGAQASTPGVDVGGSLGCLKPLRRYSRRG